MLQAAADGVWESRARCNRGILYAFQGDLAAAETDLVRARDLLLAAGQEMDAAAITWNLGCLARERGDVVLALDRFDEADPDLRSARLHRGPAPDGPRVAACWRAAWSAKRASSPSEHGWLSTEAAPGRRPHGVRGAAGADHPARRRSGPCGRARPGGARTGEPPGPGGLGASGAAPRAVGPGGTGGSRDWCGALAGWCHALDDARWAEAAIEARLAAARAAAAAGQHKVAERAAGRDRRAVRASLLRHSHPVLAHRGRASRAARGPPGRSQRGPRGDDGALAAPCRPRGERPAGACPGHRTRPGRRRDPRRPGQWLT